MTTTITLTESVARSIFDGDTRWLIVPEPLVCPLCDGTGLDKSRSVFISQDDQGGYTWANCPDCVKGRPSTVEIASDFRKHGMIGARDWPWGTVALGEPVPVVSVETAAKTGNGTYIFDGGHGFIWFIDGFHSADIAATIGGQHHKPGYWAYPVTVTS